MSYKYDPVSASINRSSTFFLAATGAVVGFSNIWKFPGLMSQHGGLLFFLVYLLCLFAISWPLLCLELGLGRITRRNPISTAVLLASRSNVSSSWQLFVWFALFAGFIVLAFYALIGGMALSYVIACAFGFFNGQSAEQVTDFLGIFQHSPLELSAWHTLFMLFVIVIVSRGVRDGLGRAARLLVPMLFFALYVFVYREYVSGDLPAATEYLFRLEPEEFTWQAFLEALNQAFFTLSLCMGVMLAFGTYMPMQMSVAKTGAGIILADTVFAVAAAVVVLPLVIPYPELPQYGFGLVFESLPWRFGQMELGQFWGGAFFVLLSLAGWSSALALAEPLVASLVETLAITRRTAAALLFVVVWLLTTAIVYSLSVWQSFRFAGLSLFGLLDFLSSKFLIPTAGILMVMFVSRRLKPDLLLSRMEFRYTWAFPAFQFHVKWVAPVALVIIFLSGLQKLTLSTCETVGNQELLICSLLNLRGFDDS